MPQFDPNLWIDRDTSVLNYPLSIPEIGGGQVENADRNGHNQRPEIWWKILDYFLNFCCLENQLKPLPSFYFLHRYILLLVSKNELLPKKMLIPKKNTKTHQNWNCNLKTECLKRPPESVPTRKKCLNSAKHLGLCTNCFSTTTAIFICKNVNKSNTNRYETVLTAFGPWRC